MSMLYKKNLQLTGACKVGIIETKKTIRFIIFRKHIYLYIYKTVYLDYLLVFRNIFETHIF